MNRSVHVYRDADDLAKGAAGQIVDVLRNALESRPRASLVLTGGGTPRETYAYLAENHHDSIDWRRVDLFWGDDRFVPPDHEESNYGMANAALMSQLEVGGVFPMPTTGDSPTRSADEYEQMIRDYHGEEEPSFDLTLLGLGDDAHVASLFPGAEALDESERLVLHTLAPEGNPVRDRITMTFAALNASRTVLFLVAGESKRTAVGRAFDDRDDTPVGRVSARERVIWCVDEEAAEDIPGEVRGGKG